MKQDEIIIAMAREAGVWDEIGYPKCIERFAALVAAHERDRIAKRVADTTLSFDLKVSHMGCEESKYVSANLSEFSKLIAEDK